MNKAIKFLLFAKDILKGRIFNKNIPLAVGLHITNRCNFNCVYCYGVYYDNRKKDLKTADILTLVDEMAVLGTRYVTLTGGEPLLRNDILGVIDHIKSKKMICSMNTNASLIRKKFNIIKKLDSVTISLDGADKETNDGNRGEGTFERIMDGIECLKENNIPFDAVTVVTKKNVGGIKGILELARKKGFMAEFNLVQEPNSEINKAAKYELADDEVKEVLKQLIRYKKEGYPILYANSSREYALNWPFRYNHKILYDRPPGNFKHLPCYMGKFMCHIDADGYVYPCIQLAGRFPALNFKEVGFKKAWENLEKNRKCKTCYAVCYNEFNHVYGLKVDVWLNNIKNVLFQKI